LRPQAEQVLQLGQVIVDVAELDRPTEPGGDESEAQDPPPARGRMDRQR